MFVDESIDIVNKKWMIMYEGINDFKMFVVEMIYLRDMEYEDDIGEGLV